MLVINWLLNLECVKFVVLLFCHKIIQPNSNVFFLSLSLLHYRFIFIVYVVIEIENLEERVLVVFVNNIPSIRYGNVQSYKYNMDILDLTNMMIFAFDV